MFLPKRFICFQESCRLNNASVVYQNVRAATKLFGDPIKRALHAFGVGDVTLNCDCLSIMLLIYLSRHCLDLLTRARCDSDRCAFIRERQSNRASNAASAASDECESIREFHKQQIS